MSIFVGQATYMLGEEDSEGCMCMLSHFNPRSLLRLMHVTPDSADAPFEFLFDGCVICVNRLELWNIEKSVDKASNIKKLHADTKERTNAPTALNQDKTNVRENGARGSLMFERMGLGDHSFSMSIIHNSLKP